MFKLKNIKAIKKIQIKQFSTELNKEAVIGTQRKRFNVLFFGNDEISKPTIEKLYLETFNDQSTIKKVGVITTPLEKKKSTQGHFHNYINEKNIEKFELDNSNLNNSWREAKDYIKTNDYNIGITASFGKMIPGSIITSFKYKSFVMHPSLLPKYRGACPIQHTILNNEKTTGVSIAETSIGKFDAGKLVLQKEIPVLSYHRFKELSFILSDLGADAVIEFLKNYDNLMDRAVTQEEDKTTYAKLIKDNNFVYLDFIKNKAEDIFRLYNAFFGSQLEPYSKLKIKEKERLIFFNNLFIVSPTSDIYTRVLSPIEKNCKPGSIYWDLKHDKSNLYIRAKDKWLVSTSVKLDCTDYMQTEILTKKFLTRKLKENSIEPNYITLAKS